MLKIYNSIQYNGGWETLYKINTSASIIYYLN